MRWLGAGLVLFSCTSLGVQTAWQWKLRLRWLEQLRQMIYFLKGEILYGHTALNEALSRVGERCIQAEGDRGLKHLPLFFLSVAERIDRQEGEAFCRIWREEMEKLRASPLQEEDRKALQNLGDHLGYLDLNMQERNLLLYLEQLDEQIAYLRLHVKERTKLYTSLGITGGLFLMIVML